MFDDSSIAFDSTAIGFNGGGAVVSGGGGGGVTIFGIAPVRPHKPKTEAIFPAPAIAAAILMLDD